MPARWWTTLLSLSLLATVVAREAPGAHAMAADDCVTPTLVPLAARLLPGLGDDSVLGLPAAEAAWVFYPVTRERALPASYTPRDLVRTAAGGSAPQGPQPMRRLIVPDLEAMLAAARADGVVLGPLSGYRSYSSQATLFDAGVQQQLARGAPDHGAAEALANRFRARPGHSQHQLGTTLDLTSPEAGNALGPRFAGSRAAQWVRERAWEFGFVVPYTESGEARTGYAPEPWHVRWVGRDLAALLMADGYLDRAEPVVDDYLLALEALLAGRLARCEGS